MSLRVRLAPLARTGLDAIDIVLRRFHDTLAEIIRQVRREQLIRDVLLEDGVATDVPHGLGYAYSHVTISPVRGAVSTGRIVDSTASADRPNKVTLTASGFGADVTVSLRVT